MTSARRVCGFSPSGNAVRPAISSPPVTISLKWAKAAEMPVTERGVCVLTGADRDRDKIHPPAQPRDPPARQQHVEATEDGDQRQRDLVGQDRQ